MYSLASEARHINARYIQMARLAAKTNPQMAKKLLGIGPELAKKLSTLTPSQIDKISSLPVLVFKPRIPESSLDELISTASDEDETMFDTVYQHALTMAH